MMEIYFFSELLEVLLSDLLIDLVFDVICKLANFDVALDWIDHSIAIKIVHGIESFSVQVVG